MAETLRDQIANIASDLLFGDHYTAFPEQLADAVLALPEIKEALEAYGEDREYVQRD